MMASMMTMAIMPMAEMSITEIAGASLAFAALLLKCLYLMLPAYFANMAPVMAKKANLFAYPVDFNKKINGKPIFGKNKTFRGFVFGIMFAIIVAFIQFLLYKISLFRSISFVSYENWLFFGFMIGIGALMGDLAKSFVKRRLGIEPGARFIPFDQTDFVFGALIFIMPIFKVTLKIFIISLLLSFALHIIVNHIAFYLGVRGGRW